MRKFSSSILYIILLISSLYVLSNNAFAATAGTTKAVDTEDDRLIRLMASITREIPDKLETLKPEYRRVAFYTLTVDRTKVNPMLLHVIRGIIESQFAKTGRVVLVEIPNLKPIKLITKDNSLIFATGLSSLEEMKKLGEEHRLDGFLEGVIDITEQNVYLSLRIVDASNGGIIWSEYMSTASQTLPPPPKASFKWEFDLGFSWLQVTEVSHGATTDVKSVPAYVTYYMPELRLYESSWIGQGLGFGIGLGLLVSASGVDVGESSLVSPDGIGFGGLYIRGYLRNRVIAKADPDMGDWLAVEFNGGRAFASKPTGFSFIGVDLVSDLSRHFSVSTGLSYATPAELNLSNTRVRIGGVLFDIFILRYYFDR